MNTNGGPTMDVSRSLISFGQLVQARESVSRAGKVLLSTTDFAPRGELFVVTPGTIAHWLSRQEPQTIIIVLHPESRDDAQPFLDYLLKDVQYTESRQ